jgi:hypothetical protein
MILLCSICQSEIPLQQPVDQNKRLATAVITAAPCPKCSEAHIAIRLALTNLWEACYRADVAEDLPAGIDGSLLDAAMHALGMKGPR